MKEVQNPSEENRKPQPPPPKPPKPKRRRRGPSFGFMFTLILVVLVAGFVIAWQKGLIHFGKEAGRGPGSGDSAASVTESAPTETTAEIKVDNDKIYLDGAEVASAEELKAKITEIGSKKSYNFVSENAIKGKYDEVYAVLTELEKSLSIKVNYNNTSN